MSNEEMDLLFEQMRYEEPDPVYFYCPCLEDLDAEVFANFVCTGHDEGFVRSEFGDQVVSR